MHCWKTINVASEYGILRLTLLAVLTFVAVFCSSYVLTSLQLRAPHTDRYMLLFFIAFLLLYPLHKAFHYIPLFDYRGKMKFRWKKIFRFVPILRMRLLEPISKKRYIFALLAPFLLLNSLFLAIAIFFPLYSHYACLLLGFHSSICLIDLINAKHLLRAPANALIEETPRGYEILIPSVL
ncbi:MULTISPECIES: DUF3267 domain-containing protein [Bacillales]|uniref:DUF3267 domain-containing protein n=1 Tax=Lysinibacillus louembei TaxID=1470088 RepID=A0ABZ0S3L2_9BACI|nr:MULTISPECIES: DUF3267 domain-containing protein [Bacillales]MCT6924661.1 DUF3267 domain-containing protein [Metasolibacillus sp.]MCT6940863.1 DUF3267 domain-containing protein [Metasolibacillus sp.]WPK13880.1 DUF3267 domain-containing protein [Lysinibacillus louembei]